jgi:signal transduction histidine kinase
MYTEIKHLQRLVEDLRTLSLADAGNLTLNMEPITPYALLDRQAATFRDLSVQQGIEFQIQVEPDLPMVNVDVERMTQVLGNLISNALRHTPGGNILLSCIRQDKTLVFKVRDTGEGIPTEAIPHVFERFYRADSARHQQGSESGLGLAIARSLVKEHGGTITVASEVGIWTEFTIHLPLT